MHFHAIIFTIMTTPTVIVVTVNILSVPPFLPPVPPAIATGNESLAFILVTENDDARGVVQFTASIFNTTEPSQDFATLVRTGGNFGEVRRTFLVPANYNLYTHDSVHIFQKYGSYAVALMHEWIDPSGLKFIAAIPFHS